MIRNLRTTLILLFSIVLVAAVTWFAPSLHETLLNVLFRLRGSLAAPADIVIVAIDDRSLQRIGQWPWPRSVMAAALDKLTQANPSGIGLDVIYAEPSTSEEDQKLAEAIARNGRVILPAQLFESADTAWLRPLPPFTQAARGLGHAHVSPEVNGVVRSIQLSKADDQANKLWAFSLEVIRAAESFSDESIKEESGRLSFGRYRVPVRDEAAAPIPGVGIIRPNEMLINFAGPAGTFQSFSIADLIEGKLPPATFAGKTVLIGATAASMGDTRVVPFMHYGDVGARQGGQEMPGVEIHANIINTIRNGLPFFPLPEWIAFAAALVVMLLSALTVRFLDGWRQVSSLLLILFSILAGSYFAFSRYLLIPPLPAMLTAFAAVIPLLLNRSLIASRQLDLKLAALVGSQKGFLPDETRTAAEFIQNQLRFDWPQSLAWKLRAVDDLTTRLLARMSFINRILSNMAEGVLVADLEGRIVFANREATQLFRCEQAALVGANLADFLIERGALDSQKLREAVTSVAAGQSVQLEFEIAAAAPRYYSLLISALPANAETENALGIVLLISDITKRVELDRMKTETLQLVSHELRTPLTSIQGLSDVLLKFPVPAEESREMLSTIHAEAVRLRETINRYLDLTRLESGAQSLRLSPVNCGKLIADCIRNLTVLAAERRILLTAEIETDLLAVQADEQLLTQALNNLLSNAVKYSPPETEIVVIAARRTAALTLSVRDQGFGIPAEARERIFEKFYRLQRDTASGVVGTGLGLPLVKEIVERHGGRITLESAEGKGSTFTIHLPLNTPAERPE